MTASRTQLRATCPACFAVQALRGGRLVQHGYRRPQHWHQNVGTCAGTGRPHFGTEAGRDYTASVVEGLRASAVNLSGLAGRVRDGECRVVLGTKRERVGGQMVTREVVIENPTSTDIAAYVQRLRAQAEQCRLAAGELEVKVAQWQPAEPVAVAVAEQAPTMHFRARFYGRSGHHACASSAMGAQQWKPTTENPDEVTCERCKQRKAFVEAVARKQG
jgi:hypothetical protein